jgi:molybdopterin converting factor small subunit
MSSFASIGNETGRFNRADKSNAFVIIKFLCASATVADGDNITILPAVAGG